LEASLFELAQGVNQSADPQVLDTIAMKGVAVAIWNRQFRSPFQAWLDGLPADRLPRLHTLVAVQSVEPAVHAACDSVGLPNSPEREMLAGDVAMLALIFANILHQPLLRLKLDILQHEAAEKFHIGNVRARLFCAYRSAGLEFGACEPDGIPRESFALPVGMPAVFRGLLWQGVELSRVAYRLVPITAPDEIRLLLTIDPADGVTKLS
jgi:hypothetical protein